MARKRPRYKDLRRVKRDDLGRMVCPVCGMGIDQGSRHYGVCCECRTEVRIP
jgi:hypothetical protein